MKLLYLYIALRQSGAIHSPINLPNKGSRVEGQDMPGQAHGPLVVGKRRV